MKIDFERFGCIDKGSVELNDFTIFCGKNNTGKTYVMYAFYCIFDIVNLDILNTSIKGIIEKLKDIYKKIEEQEEETKRLINIYFILVLIKTGTVRFQIKI